MMINDEADKVIKQLFDSLRNRNWHDLKLIKGSGFIFDYVYLLYYKYQKINTNHRES